MVSTVIHWLVEIIVDHGIHPMFQRIQFHFLVFRGIEGQVGRLRSGWRWTILLAVIQQRGHDREGMRMVQIIGLLRRCDERWNGRRGHIRLMIEYAVFIGQTKSIEECHQSKSVIIDPG